MSRPILAEYCRAGWALVPIPRGRKGPIAPGWQASREACVTVPEVAAQLDDGIGLCHAYSGTCALDIDDVELARKWLKAHGISLDALWNAPDAVRISSGRPNHGKLLYRLGKPICSKKIVEGKFNILDFRCGTRVGTTCQDVLPPTIHPDTKKPYAWDYADDSIGHWSCLPQLPADVKAIWEGLVAAPEGAVPEATQRAPTPSKLGPARRMLYDNDPDCDRERWVEIGMILHHTSAGGLDGLDLWDEWSARSKKYQGRPELETIWRGFRPDAQNPVTINSLRVDTAAEIEEFSPVTEAMVAAAQMPMPKASVASAIKDVMNQLRRDKMGKAMPILPNLMPILSVPELCGQHLAYDEFKDMLVCAPAGTNEWRPIRDTDYTATRLWLENAANFLPVGKDLVRDAIYYIAEAHRMDTAQNWLTSLKWDGKPRVRNFLPLYLGTIATEYEYAVGEYIWTALAGRVMDPGCQADMAMILIGPQGIGKSQGIKAMAPSPDQYAEIRLDESDEAIARKIRGVLIGELAELRGVQSELLRTKAFITRTHEKWVPKYVEFATTFARRIVFIGTTNEDEILVDEEERRWLPVRTAGVDVAGIRRDCEQLWAEAVILWMERGVNWKGAQELAKDEHPQYRVLDNWAEIVERWIAEHKGEKIFRTEDVMLQAVGLDSRHVTRAHQLRVGSIMKQLGYKSATKREGNKVFRIWAQT